MKSVFISSTFKDMQAERDMLHERIFPRLRKLINEYGEDIQELDLRWGVDTVAMSEEESSHQVLQVCIDAIDRCRPYIIVLLGERYGWIPGRNVVESLRDARVDAWYEDQMSITNLEIKYGALSEEETLQNCVFCFRNPGLIADIDEECRSLYRAESPLHREKLDALKEQIRAKKEAVILDYEAGWDNQRKKVCDLEAFGELLYEKLAEMIRRDFSGRGAKSEGEQIALKIERMSEQYRSSYVNRCREEWIIMSGILLRKPGLLSVSEGIVPRILIRGDGGSGKSALMAGVEYAARMAGCETILYFSGASGCQNMNVLKNFVIYRLEKICGLSHEETDSQDSRLRFLAEQARDKKVCCFIDGLDQLFKGEDGGRLDLLDLCPNFYFVLSVLSDELAKKWVKDYVWDFKTLHLENLTMAERRQIVAKTALKRGKKLDEKIVQMTVAQPGAGNPLYLSMLLQRYFMMDQQEFEAAERIAPGMEGLHQYMEQLSQDMPDGAEEMATYLLAVTGRRFGLTWFQEILQLLVLSEYGLSERELEGLLTVGGMNFLQVEFQQMASYLYDAFALREDGKWVLSHRLFQEAVARQIEEKERAAAEELFIRYSLEEPEFLEKEGFLYIFGQRHEAGWQVLEQAGGWKTKRQVLDYVGREVICDAGSREYYLELTKRAQVDTLCDFWLSFKESDYEPAFADFLGQIWQELLAMERISAGQRVACALRLARYYAGIKRDREMVFHYLGRAGELCSELLEPEKSMKLSEVVFECARKRMQYNGCMEWETARGEFVRAQELLEPLLLTGDTKESGEIVRLKIGYKVEQAWSISEYQKIPAQGALEECLEELSACGGDGGKTDREEQFVEMEAMICRDLTHIYTSHKYFDSEKALARGQRALELSEWLIQRNPSTEYLQLRMDSLENYTYCFEPGYRYPYREEYLYLARKIYCAYSTDYWKKHLAWAACIFGRAVDDAVMDRSKVFPDELWEKGKKSWEEGFLHYEELIRKGCEERICWQYEYFLRRKAAVDAKQGYRREAMRKAKRSRELLQKDSLTGGNVPTGMDWKLFDSDLILAKALSEVCRAKEALPYVEEAFQMARIYQERTGKIYKDVAEALLVYARLLYYLRRDEEAIAACEKAEEAYNVSADEGVAGRSVALGELAYIRGRIFLEQGQITEAESCQEVFESLCANEKASWEYGRNLLLKGDLLLAEQKVQEAEAVYTEAEEYWRDRTGKENSRFKKQVSYRVFERRGYIYRKVCMSEAGYAMRSVYYLLYSLYKLRQITGTWDGSYSSILGLYSLEHSEKYAMYVEWLWLPAKIPAFAKLTAVVPQEIKEKWLDAKCPAPIEKGIKGRIQYIAFQEKENLMSAPEILSEIVALIEETRSSCMDYEFRLELGKKYAAIFQMEEEQGECIATSREQRELFAREYQAERVWYPLLELLVKVWHHHEVLSSEEIKTLYKEAGTCFSYAEKHEPGRWATGEWDLSSLSKDALELIVASGDEKEWYSLSSHGRNKKNICILELYHQTGEWEYIRRRLEELFELAAYLEEREHHKKKQLNLLPDTGEELNSSIVMFLCQVLKIGGAGDAGKVAAFLWKNVSMRDIKDDILLSELRMSLTDAVREQSTVLDTGLLEQVEEFFAAGYRMKWERIQENINL